MILNQSWGHYSCLMVRIWRAILPSGCVKTVTSMINACLTVAARMLSQIGRWSFVLIGNCSILLTFYVYTLYNKPCFQLGFQMDQSHAHEGFWKIQLLFQVLVLFSNANFGHKKHRIQCSLSPFWSFLLVQFI